MSEYASYDAVKQPYQGKQIPYPTDSVAREKAIHNEFRMLREAVLQLTDSVDILHNRLLTPSPPTIEKSDHPEPRGIISEMTFEMIQLRSMCQRASELIMHVEDFI